MRFLRREPYKMSYKTSMNEDGIFKILDLLPRQVRPRSYNNIELTLLYKNVSIATLKYNDIMDLLHYIPPVHHNYFKFLPHTQVGEKWIINYEILFECNISLIVNKYWIFFNFITQNCNIFFILREFYFFQGTYVVLKIKKVISLIPKVV